MTRFHVRHPVFAGDVERRIHADIAALPEDQAERPAELNPVSRA
jgi:hypothetical protein